MSYAPLFFNQLTDLTALRDIELMEFSVLKTQNGLLMPLGLRILKVDMNKHPCIDIIFNNSECIVNTENIKFPRNY